MTTSSNPSPARAADAAPESGPLRLRLSEGSGDRLDGGWWPRSRDLATELPDLIAGFPAGHGRIMRAVYSPPDWDGHSRRVTLPRGYVKVGSFPHDDTHVIDLQMTDRSRLRLLVVPSRTDDPEGTEALDGAATVGNTRSPAELLGTASPG